MSKSIRLSSYVSIIKPEYVYLKLKPNNSIRNNGTHKLARAISNLHKTIFENIKKEDERLVRFFGKEIIVPSKISIQTNAKVGYLLYMEKKRIDFYFVIPKNHLAFLKEKISDVWSSVTVEIVDTLPHFSDGSLKQQIIYKKEDGLSLTVDRRSNELLNSQLNVVEMLEESERVGIFYNFIPNSQYGWRYKHKATIEKFKSGKPVERDKAGWSYIFKWTLSLIDDILGNVVDAVSGGDSKSKSKTSDVSGISNKLFDHFSNNRKLSEASMKKGSASTLSLQILTMTESHNKIREKNISRSLSQSFDAISEDNELIYKPYRRTFKYTDYSVRSERIRVGDEESQNFLALAGRDVLERFDFIDHVETNETEVPEDLQQGVMCIGENIYRGKRQRTYLSNDIEFRNLLLLLIGPTRAGKSNLLSHLCTDALENGEAIVLFDFIENCELSDSIAKLFPKEKVLEIRCDDYDKIQGLGYNEVGKSNDTFKQYENAKKQTSCVLSLINSVHSDEAKLSPRMERFLESASLVVFISNGSIKDVFSVLTNFRIRAQFLNKVPQSQYSNLEEYIESLHELNDTDKDGSVVGTKTNLITGIIDRLQVLKRNSMVEMSLKKDTTNNIDLSEEIQKNQLIVIKMPQSMFLVESEKDTYSLYWATKLWMSLLIRAEKIRDKSKRTKVNLIIDEIYQTEHLEKFITSKLSQTAKFSMKPIISCHYINQLKYMRDELRSANTSYMLLAGCDKKNFDELKNELYPFTDEDLKNMKRYYSMNYVKNKDGYARFITALPDKVEKRIKKGKVAKDDSKD